jgi:hypothetical protein
MEVTRYIFQSPYSNQVQVGKPDASSSQETKSEDLKVDKRPSEAPLPKSMEVQKPIEVQKSQTPEGSTTEPEVNLDTYA